MGFNPRAHVGRDKISNFNDIKEVSFNPRAHVGRDLIKPNTMTGIGFQSTRPRGARRLSA